MLNIGSILYLVLTSFVTGGLLNRWLLQRRFNGESWRFFFTGGTVIMLVSLFLLSNDSCWWDESLVLGLSIIIPMTLGIFVDEKIIYKWVNGHKC